ncbi:MAG: exosortase/archaeosortase family protein [Planctomycetota bacterium]|nr:MAG: exosortase/archaeosortase family protein [Planctomycetota bacterium]
MSGTAAASYDWRISFDRAAQVKAALIAVAFSVTFWGVYRTLYYHWTHNADWSHGPLIPLFSAYLVYLKWDQIKRCPVRHAWVGLGLLIFALAAYQYSLWGVLRIGYFRPLMMMLALLGVMILLCGLPMLRYTWIAWAYLFFAIPLPKGVYFAITNPLREWAALVATAILGLFPNLDIEQTGSVINYFYDGRQGQLGVADACSGMRSTITLCALGVAVAFITDRPLWQRVVLIASCVPIAIFSNLIRVTVTCILHIFVDPAYAEGNFHMALGLATILIAFGIFSGLAWMLNHLVIEDVEETADPPTPSAA